ncbi:DUF4230 domain-containing protein [Flavobacteriaceae bacterium F89]|uniref:DUF4230 domain-containing protein n=1 Tax=Cerina litoralis TaxID=2874477 RepID=A0AAE3ETA2_9FLAO|nr:DUF4230 domain-containing protein [Cerina litoralis]MCG2459799.1 DUF4230 domain-containing protein [Cerina litoralis]
MKKFLFGVLITLALVLVFRSCKADKTEKSILTENSMLIQQEIQNVSKLIVTEGHFAEVYNYKDSQQLFGPLITADKKALVVVNAEVTVAYDLAKIKFHVDEKTKTLQILSIPQPEIKLNPDFEYYDVTADYLNPFKAEDYNEIKNNVKASLMKKVEASSLKSNAKNRLISELSKFYILTHSMGWKLVYGDQILERIEDLNAIKD